METSDESPWLNEVKMSNFFASEFLNDISGVDTDGSCTITSDSHDNDLLETTDFDLIQLVKE